jgi:multidrug resistance efflux pump
MSPSFFRRGCFAFGVTVVLGAAVLPRALSADAETKPATTQSTTAPAGPATVKVTRGDLNLEVRAEAVFQPIDPFEAKLTFKVYQGPLVITSVAAPGAMVRKGETVLAFDRTWIDWSLQSAESELAVAKANQTKAETDAKLAVAGEALAMRQAEDGAKIAESQKKWFEDVDGPQMLLTADLQVKMAQNAVDDQNDELDQLRKMYQGEELTAATADIVVRRAVRALEQSKIGLKMQQERRDKVKGFDYPITRQRVLDGVETSKQGLAAAKAAQEQTAVTRAAGLLSAKLGVEQASRKLAELKEDAAQFQIRAGSDGTVVYGNQVDGQWVGGDAKAFKIGEKLPAGSVLLRVYQPKKLRLSLSLPESQAFWVEQGMKARVTPAATPQHPYEAKTSALEVVNKGQGVGFLVNVDLSNADERLIPGMKASVVIEAGKVSDVLLVPLASVTAGKVQVKQKDGTFAEKEVKLGRTDGQQVEVKSGLSEGDEIKK